MPDQDSPSASDDEHQRLAAQYRLEEMAAHPRIQLHCGKLAIGQLRCAIFNVDSGTLVIGSATMIHVEVIERAGLRIDEGTYLSGFVHVADDGTLEWITSGALSSFPPDNTGLPFDEVLDRIRGTGVRIAT
ncbi:MAG TPA: hypothetical protein VKX17_07800 [Planctomycetota bacterium]|nr:hypothetical protein [Planctomycetota bacterium]